MTKIIHHRHKQEKNKFHRIKRIIQIVIITLICILLIGGIGIWIFQLVILQKTATPYQGIVIYGNPVMVIMHDAVAKKTATFTLPNTIVLETKKYGALSLASLWRLGDIEKKQGSILMESISDALGVPMTWYIGKQSESLSVSTLASYQSLFIYSAFGYQTNMQLVDFLRFWTIARKTDLFFSPATAVETLSAITRKQLSDGSTVETLDIGRLDIQLGNKRELTTLRKEQLTVIVSNASGESGIGQHVGRLLSNIGIRVAAVTTDPETLETCELIGTKDSLKTITSSLIVSFWGCAQKEVPTFERSDLTLRAGKQFIF